MTPTKHTVTLMGSTAHATMPNDRQAMRRSCPPPRLSRRELLGLLALVVSIVTNIKTWFTPPLPQRQAVELSGVTHHRVDAGSVSWSFRLSQPTVTVVRAPVVWRA